MSGRGNFSSRIGFILAAAGSAVGLGNIWKFPFEVADGGGAAFVFIYLIFAFLLCFPVMVTEVSIGRRTEKNPIGAFNDLGFKKWNIVGKFGILCGTLILSFYNVVAGWAFGYFIEMVLGNFEIGKHFGIFTSNILKISGYSIAFMLATAFIVSKGVSGGIERLAKILMPTLVIMILTLMIYSFTLPNALEGVKYYLIPDLSKLSNLNTIGGALRQAFFSLSLGMGALITYGSYLSKKENIVSSVALITLTDVGIAFIAGLMMFPLVAYNLGGDMSNAEGGAGLIFTVLPSVFQTLGPTLGVIVGSFFFLLLSFAALTSTVSLLEVPVSYIVDEHHIKRNKATVIMSIIIFLVGIPSLLANGYSDFFTNKFSLPNGSTDFMTVIAYITDVLLMFGGALIVIFAIYVWKRKNLSDEISQGFHNYKSSFIKKLLEYCISCLCPTILIILFIMVVCNNFFGINLLEKIEQNYIISTVFYLITTLGLWNIFEKTHYAGWKALIPIYNVFILLKIINKPIWSIILLFIPAVNIVYVLVLFYLLAKQFQKSNNFAIMTSILSFIFIPMLGIDDNAHYIEHSKNTKR